ncbi:hypothetical protein LguiA_020659 [Lonicera macranthoides]
MDSHQLKKVTMAQRQWILHTVGGQGGHARTTTTTTTTTITITIAITTNSFSSALTTTTTITAYYLTVHFTALLSNQIVTVKYAPDLILFFLLLKTENLFLLFPPKTISILTILKKLTLPMPRKVMQEGNKGLEAEDDEDFVFVLTDEWKEFFTKSEAKRRLVNNPCDARGKIDGRTNNKVCLPNNSID